VPTESITFRADHRAVLGGRAPAAVAALGDTSILATKTCALFCSARCPGDIILRTLDLVVALRSADIPVISGFHTPMERECLALLLRGRQPVVICPARSIHDLRLPQAWGTGIDAGRVLLLSPFPAGRCRPTLQTAAYRNRFVAALATSVFVACASPGGNTEQLIREVVAWGTPVFTFAADATDNLKAIGARPIADEAAWIRNYRE
jgi:predicted Rossmann fold nucleotide-binding protein DprA/Smf involved in DNA uptake